jgi:hypothetical protein
MTVSRVGAAASKAHRLSPGSDIVRVCEYSALPNRHRID